MTHSRSAVSNNASDHSDIINYISQIPGLHRAVEIGRQAVVHQYLTVVEMCESLRLQVDVAQIELLDRIMCLTAEVLMLAPQAYRLSTVGSCVLIVREYPGCLFPFFLNILKTQGFQYDD